MYLLRVSDYGLEVERLDDMSHHQGVIASTFKDWAMALMGYLMVSYLILVNPFVLAKGSCCSVLVRDFIMSAVSQLSQNHHHAPRMRDGSLTLHHQVQAHTESLARARASEGIFCGRSRQREGNDTDRHNAASGRSAQHDGNINGHTDRVSLRLMRYC